MSEHAQTTITADFEVTGWEQTPYDEGATGPALARATVSKTFTGALEGTSVAELLLCGGPAGRGYVASERVVGTLDGHRGSFVIQHGGIAGAEDDGGTFGHIVPGSGTEELESLRGGDVSYLHEGEVARITMTYEL